MDKSRKFVIVCMDIHWPDVVRPSVDLVSHSGDYDQAALNKIVTSKKGQTFVSADIGIHPHNHLLVEITEFDLRAEYKAGKRVLNDKVNNVTTDVASVIAAMSS